MTRLQAVGMIEFNSIAAGIEAADAMLKAASVVASDHEDHLPGQVRGRRPRQTWPRPGLR